MEKAERGAAACGEMISAGEQGSIEYRYPTQVTSFHPRCHELREAGRHEAIRRA